ncbi:magnesium transporter CorA family protein [Nonomuraea zeae]|uniref:Magnesium transporter CorA family protein n=1 Tax=Nonomuraea zeae TaxID=1642303 RepID=A0A5S4GMY0_9ACTN|nr:magnesium transporter CorA family protein [Nonomuraea zeae]TMR34233.1 magnesium transporter CorA family protein [Nonomuraea zeae]
MARTRLYRHGVLEAEGFPVSDVSDFVADPGCAIWFDLCSPSPADLNVISEELGLHALAVEDVLHDRQRPKLDVYDSHLFLTVYGERLDPDTGQLDSTEINIFVTRTALVTVRENDQFDIDEVVKRWDASRDLAKHGVGFLLHGLLDVVVDGHFEVIQALDDQIETLEGDLFGEQPSREMQRHTFALRKSLVQFRRGVLPMREVINSLLRRDLHVVEPPMAPYYQDVYDHVLRVTEWTDSLRDLVSNIRETHLSQQGYRLNTIMKKLTSWAAIIAIPTMITGFYGQNVPYPGADQPIGFWTSSIVIVTASLGLYLAFRKRDWL